MPIYEFKCPNCGKITEQLCHQTDIQVTPCKCGGEARRKMSACNFSFGWRLTEASHLPGHKDEFERDV